MNISKINARGNIYLLPMVVVNRVVCGKFLHLIRWEPELYIEVLRKTEWCQYRGSQPEEGVVGKAANSAAETGDGNGATWADIVHIVTELDEPNFNEFDVGWAAGFLHSWEGEYNFMLTPRVLGSVRRDVSVTLSVSFSTTCGVVKAVTCVLKFLPELRRQPARQNPLCIDRVDKDFRSGIENVTVLEFCDHWLFLFRFDAFD